MVTSHKAKTSKYRRKDTSPRKLCVPFEVYSNYSAILQLVPRIDSRLTGVPPLYFARVVMFCPARTGVLLPQAVA